MTGFLTVLGIVAAVMIISLLIVGFFVHQAPLGEETSEGFREL
jgi:hypothetical protein